MGSDFQPIRTFSTRSEVAKYLDETSHLDWVESDELQGVFVEEKCFVASNRYLLMVPLGRAEKLRRRAELFPNVTVFTDDEEPIIPFIPGFQEFESDPDGISKLGREFLRSVGIGEGFEPKKLAACIDDWIQIKRQKNEIFALIKDDRGLCKLCASIGEVVRSYRSIELQWIVQQEKEPLSGETLFVANLIAPNGGILGVSLEIYGQLADPDWQNSENLAQSFLS